MTESGRPPGWGRWDGNKRAELLQPVMTIHSAVVDHAVAEIRQNPRIEVGGKFVGYVHGDFSAADRDWRGSFNRLRITVLGNLDAGPARDRSAVHHYSDTNYQLRLFQRLSAEFPALCFLGIWHSHHPNGLRELSGGDRETGLRTVNSAGHDLDLLLSSLAFDDSGLLGGRHFVFLRGHETCYEIDGRLVGVTDGPNPVAAAVTRIARWLHSQESEQDAQEHAQGSPRRMQAGDHINSAELPASWLQSPDGRAALAFDNAWLREYPSLRPAMRDGGVIWQGPVDVGSTVFSCAYHLPGLPGTTPVAEFSAHDYGLSLRVALPDAALRAARFAACLHELSALVATSASESADFGSGTADTGPIPAEHAGAPPVDRAATEPDNTRALPDTATQSANSMASATAPAAAPPRRRLARRQRPHGQAGDDTGRSE